MGRIVSQVMPDGTIRALTGQDPFPRFPPELRGSLTVGKAEHQIYLRKYPPYDNRDSIIQTFHFPVNPETITVAMGRDTVEVPVLELGNLIRPGARTPRAVQFDSFFPNPEAFLDDFQAPGWLNMLPTELPDPWTTVDMIRGWQNSKPQYGGLSPLLLTITETGVNMYAVMTQFDVNTKPQEVGDVYFTCEFREMVTLPTISRARKAGTTTPTRVDPKGKVREVKTVAGENLVTIAKRAFKKPVTPAQIDQIYALNKAAVGTDKLVKLKAGLTIKLPQLPNNSEA